MTVAEHADIQTLEAALDAIDKDTQNLVDGLTAEQGIWRSAPGGVEHRALLRKTDPARPGLSLVGAQS